MATASDNLDALSVPDPRTRSSLVGHQAAENAFYEACHSGRLHHAWLIAGPEGIGKATFAFRAARFVLGLPQSLSQSGLEIDPAHPIFGKVAALSHPDFALVQKAEGANLIKVDDVRAALHLFESTSGTGGYRVCIVDSADDLNINAANALLKMLEEPPPRSLFLIIAHQPGLLLPTIRSRCRKLNLMPLKLNNVVEVLQSLGEPFFSMSENELLQAAQETEGSIRGALEVLDPHTKVLVQQVRAILHKLPFYDRKSTLQLAEKLTGKSASRDMRIILDVVSRFVAQTIHIYSSNGARSLICLVEGVEEAHRSAREADVYNLDRRAIILKLISNLAYTYNIVKAPPL